MSEEDTFVASIREMMDHEGFERLELDKQFNVVTLYPSDDGDDVTSVSLDLLSELERVAEKSNDSIFVMEGK